MGLSLNEWLHMVLSFFFFGDAAPYHSILSRFSFVVKMAGLAF
jgi:hypothetical protein